MDPEKKSCGISFTPKEKNYCFDEITISIVVGLVDWLSGCKYGFIPYLQNNWTLHVSTIVTF
jgi:hypothetical protein